MPTEVLIVEDTADIREALTLILEDEGFEVRSAVESTEAFDLLEDWTPDAVLLDINLPGISGIDILKQIRGNISGPILMFTSSGDSEEVKEAIAAGANDYVLKGSGMDRLVDRIRKHLVDTDGNPEVSAATSEPNPADQPDLIYVGRDKEIEALMSDAARRFDLKAAKVEHGETAMQGLQVHQPHVMVVDLKLPDIDGLTLLKNIRSQDELKGVAIVMVAERGAPEIKRSAMHRGAAAFYFKPVKDMEFEQVIRIMVDARRQGAA